MKTCRHLAAFKITVEVIDPGKAGMPPWGALCEDCASTAVEALRHQRKTIAEAQPRPSGKSGRAVSWARAGRLLDDWLGPEDGRSDGGAT